MPWEPFLGSHLSSSASHLRDSATSAFPWSKGEPSSLGILGGGLSETAGGRPAVLWAAFLGELGKLMRAGMSRCTGEVSSGPLLIGTEGSKHLLCEHLLCALQSWPQHLPASISV